MHVETGRNIALRLVEELAELLCTVARHACADYVPAFTSVSAVTAAIKPAKSVVVPWRS